MSVRRLALRRIALAAVAFALLGCTEATDEPSTNPDETTTIPGGKTDIYGDDDRRERYAAPASVQAVARSTVALVAAHRLTTVDANTRSLSTLSWSDSVASTRGGPLCSSEPFRQQPAGAFCSGFHLRRVGAVLGRSCMHLARCVANGSCALCSCQAPRFV